MNPNGFTIRKVTIQGAGGKKAEAVFNDGVNIILGPSNTGKSLIIESINYCFGYKYKKGSKKPDHSQKLIKLKDLGYSDVAVTLNTVRGQIRITRALGEDKSVSILSTDELIKSGDYLINDSKTKPTLNEALLALIGIHGEHLVHAAKSMEKASRVSFRSVMNMFYVNQTDVSTDQPILYNRETPYPQVYSKALFLYLLNENNYDTYTKKADQKLLQAKNDGVVDYLSTELTRLSDRHDKLVGILEDNNYSENFAAEIKQQIGEIKAEIDSATVSSKALMSQIYTLNSKRSEGATIHEQFLALQSQYDSDVKRMTFVVDAKKAITKHPVKDVCPLCGSPLHSEDQHEDYAGAIRAELAQLQVKIQDLAKADQDIQEKNKTIEDSIPPIVK